MHTLLQTLGLAAAVAETVAAHSRVASAMFEGDIHTAYEVGQREAEADWLRTQGG